MQPLEMVWILRFVRRIDEYVIATFSSVAPWRRQLGENREANGIGELPCPQAPVETRLDSKPPDSLSLKPMPDDVTIL